MLGTGVIDHMRLSRGAAVGDRDPHHRAGPGDLDHERAAAPAGGVAYRVCRKLAGDDCDVVARRAGREQRCQPPPQQAELALFTGEHPPPPQPGCGPG